MMFHRILLGLALSLLCSAANSAPASPTVAKLGADDALDAINVSQLMKVDGPVDPAFFRNVTPGPFQPSWKSLAGYTYPDWFRDAKFGIS